MKIHPTAIVDKNAKLADDIEVGPYAIIGPNVEAAKGNVIGARATVEGYTTLGEGNRIFTGAVIGSIPQDLKYKGKKSFLKIGKNNIIREFVTMNPGTEDGASTYVGDGNAYDYCLHIGSSVWLDKELIVSWQGLTDRYINDQVVFYGTAPEWRSMDPGVRPAKWLTRFTVGPQGIGFGSDSVSISATETAIPPPPPPPPGVTIVFTNPQISLFNVSTSTNAGDPIDVSWQSRDTKFCQLSTYTADLKVNDSDGPITATPIFGK